MPRTRIEIAYSSGLSRRCSGCEVVSILIGISPLSSDERWLVNKRWARVWVRFCVNSSSTGLSLSAGHRGHWYGGSHSGMCTPKWRLYLHAAVRAMCIVVRGHGATMARRRLECGAPGLWQLSQRAVLWMCNSLCSAEIPAHLRLATPELRCKQGATEARDATGPGRGRALDARPSWPQHSLITTIRILRLEPRGG